MTTSAHLQRYADVVGAAVGRVGIFSLVYGAGCLIYILTMSVTSASLSFQVPVLVVAALLIALEFAFIWTDSRRRSLFDRWKRWGPMTPVLLTALYLPLSIGFFSSLTVILTGHGLVDLAMTHVSDDVLSGRVADFYSWHLLDAVPLLDINETLRWSVPLTYKDGAVGALLLTFKVLVILPAIGVFRTYFQYRKSSPSQ